MFDKTKIPDDLVDQYLRGQLSDDERVQFEVRMLEDPHFFDVVQQAELMHQAFKGQKDRVGPRAKNVSYLPFRAWIKQPLSWAASLMLGIGVLLLANDGSRQSDTDGLQSGYAVNSVVSVGRTRSTNDEIVLSSGVHLLQIDVGISMSDAPYTVRLTGLSDTQVYEFQVSPDGNGVVRLLTPATLQGRYELNVQQQGREEGSGAYRIRFD
jgi:hypothetical protein